MRISFRRWLEDLENDPSQVRSTILSILGQITSINDKDGLTTPLRNLDMKQIIDRLNKGFAAYQDNPNREDAEELIQQKPNATIGDFIDVLASGPAGPRPINQNGDSGLSGAGGL